MKLVPTMKLSELLVLDVFIQTYATHLHERARTHTHTHTHTHPNEISRDSVMKLSIRIDRYTFTCTPEVYTYIHTYTY